MDGQSGPLYARGTAPPNRAYVGDPYPPLNPGEATRASQRLVDEITIHCDILGRLMQSFSGEAMAHDDRIRAHLSRMESSPIRRVRQRTDAGHGTVNLATHTGEDNVSSFPPLRYAETNHYSAGEDQHCHEGEGEQTRDDTHRAEPSHDGHAEEENVQDDEGDSAALMQRPKKRKRGSPEPAPRPAGSTASFSWRTLRPPRGTPRARGRGRSVSSRPIIPKAKARTAREEVCENDYEEEEEEEVPLQMEGEAENGPRSAAAPTTLPDDEEINRREEHYQNLRRIIGVGAEGEEPENAPLGFHADTEAIQAQWDPLSAGELLARVGHFLRIISQMMEEIGYMAEVISRGHRPHTEGDATNLMQATKRPLPAGDRRRASEKGTNTDEGDEECKEELPSSSTARMVGRRNTRNDAVPREEDLTSEDWAIMAAVERCPVWRTLKAFNLKEREKLLAAIRLVFQETVEGNSDICTISGVEDFRNWARRWGEDDDHAQLTLQNQWDNLLRHLMGITASMEVWGPTDMDESGETHAAEGGLVPTIGGNVGDTPRMGATTMSGPVAPDIAPMEVEATVSNPMSGNTADDANQPPEAEDRLVERCDYGGYDVIAAVENGEHANPE